MLRITIHSYKGGTGKTTITVNLANQLSKQGERVLLIETDYLMPVYHGIFSRLTPRRFFNELYEKTRIDIKQLIYNFTPRLDIVFANPEFTPDDALFKINQDQFGRKVSAIIQNIVSIQDEYDYILFDTSPGWNFPLIGNLVVSDIILVILRPNIYEIQGTKRLVKEIYRKARLTRDLQVVALFNQIPNVNYGSRYEEWKLSLERDKIPVIGEISCSCELSQELGWGVTLVKPDSFLYSNLEQIISELKNKDMKIKD